MIYLNNICYKLPDGRVLFDNISINFFDSRKSALIGDNGIGKSCLIKIIANVIKPYSGTIKCEEKISYFPQDFYSCNYSTVAEALGIDEKIKALEKIENNLATEQDYLIINNDWNFRENTQNYMKKFNLNFSFDFKYKNLSGGEKTKLLLIKIINSGGFLLLDEPTNNMDEESKEIFIDFIKQYKKGMLIISHDRELLNVVDEIYEMRKLNDNQTKIFNYSVAYNEYNKIRQNEITKEETKYNTSLKLLNVQKQQIQNNIKQRQQRENIGKKSRNKGDNLKSSFDLKTMDYENKMGKMAKIDKNKLLNIQDNIDNLQQNREFKSSIYFKMPQIQIPKNKIILNIENLNFSYGKRQLFKDFNLTISGNERVALCGNNGSGKSTLLKIISNQIQNYTGKVYCAYDNLKILDQQYNLLIENKTVLENLQQHNSTLTESESRSILATFLFWRDDIYKKVKDLSGGEKVKLALCCLLHSENQPNFLILDEPTNNLDLKSISIIENCLNQYQGALLIVSHDKEFRERIGIEKEIII